MLDKGINLEIFEMKGGETIFTKHFEGLTKFEGISNIPVSKKALIFTGESNQNRSQGSVISWKDLPSIFGKKDS